MKLFTEEDGKRIKSEFAQIRHWGDDFTAIWLNSKGKCAYCDHELAHSAADWFYATEVDHLYPKDSYPKLQWMVWNRVLSCRRCNNLKRSLDPQTFGFTFTGELTSEQRNSIIQTVKAVIETRKLDQETRLALETNAMTAIIQKFSVDV